MNVNCLDLFTGETGGAKRYFDVFSNNSTKSNVVECSAMEKNEVYAQAHTHTLTD